MGMGVDIDEYSDVFKLSFGDGLNGLFESLLEEGDGGEEEGAIEKGGGFGDRFRQDVAVEPRRITFVRFIYGRLRLLGFSENVGEILDQP